MDTNFLISVIARGTVNGIVLRPTGELVAAGNFNLVQPLPSFFVAQFDGTGFFDPLFQKQTSYYGINAQVAIQADGKVLVGGSSSPSIRRANVDGSIDFEFNKRGLSGRIFMRPDDGFLLQKVSTGQLQMFDKDGNIEPSFSTSAQIIDPIGRVASLRDTVNCAVFLSDNSVIIGGKFTHVNGIPRPRLAKLSSTGVLDPAFAPVIGTNYVEEPWDAVWAILPLLKGGFLVGGELFGVQNHNVPAKNPGQPLLVRVDSDGVVQETLEVPLEINRIEQFLALPSGSILFRGIIEPFFTSKGVGRLFKLDSSSPLPPAPSLAVEREGDSIKIACPGNVLLEVSDDLAGWEEIAGLVNVDDHREYTVSLQKSEHRFFRGVIR